MRLDEKKAHNIIKISFRLVIMEVQKIVNIAAKHLGITRLPLKPILVDALVFKQIYDNSQTASTYIFSY